MPKRAIVKYRSLRSNLVHLPLSLYVSLAQSLVRPQSLVVHLTPVAGSTPSTSSSRRSPSPAYLGWSGLAAATSASVPGSLRGSAGGNEEPENVEVDPEVAMSYSWAEGTVVEISIVRDPTKARSVSVTPMSPDDWEILEQNANFLENNLLGQLRAAHKGQEIDVWVLGRTRIRIRVDETNPPTTTSSAVLVNAETEVFVAPRPRDKPGQIKPDAIPTQTLVVPKAKEVIGKAEKRLEAQMTLRYAPPRVAAKWGTPEVTVPGRVKPGHAVGLCSPETWDRIAGLGKKGSSSGVFVRVTRKTKADEKVWKEQDGEEDGDQETSMEVWLVPWEEVPDDCLTLSGRVDDHWKDWTFVQLSLLEPKHTRGKGDSSQPVPPFDPQPQQMDLLAGVDDIIAQAIAYLTRAAYSPAPRPLLITGSHGSGKTSIAKTVASALEADRSFLTEVVYQDVGRVGTDQKPSTIRETLGGWLDDAAGRAPCVMILDDLEMLLGPENELTPSSNAATLADSFCRLFAPRNIPENVLVIATATSVAALHPLLNVKHVFGEVVKIAPFTKEIRREVLRILVNAGEMTLPGVKGDIDYVTLATSTEGYGATDLRDLVAGATQQAIIRCSKSGDKIALTMNDFVSAQEAFTPLNLRGSALQKSSTRWADIGGLHEARRVLKETLEWPNKYAQIFANAPLRLRSGLLLYGYPGCGKTLLASAVARECGLNFISVKGPEILNKYIGASEKAVRDLFERATAAKPCVLFFDEFDSIAPKRGHDSTGVTDRVVNQMLTEMDGAQGLEGVYVLAATSRPDLIDPALLRPGRLDKSILCGMPGKSDRLEILQALSRKLHLDPSVDFEEIARETEGFSGADLQALVYNAHLDVVHASIAESREASANSGMRKGKGKSNGEDGGEKEMNGRDLVKRKLEYKFVQPKIGGSETAAEKAALASRLETIVLNTRITLDSQSDARGLGNDLETDKAQPVIEMIHLRQSMTTTRPSVSAKDRNKLDKVYEAFVGAKREAGMMDGDFGQETGSRVSLM